MDIISIISISLSSPEDKVLISGSVYDKGDSIQGSELRKVIKKLESKSLIKSTKMSNKATEYLGYKLIEKGLDLLKKIQREN